MTPTKPPYKMPSASGLYTIRMYEGFEHYWFDIKAGLRWESALEEWQRLTTNGTRHACFEHGDYYSIFPAQTKMLFDEPLDHE